MADNELRYDRMVEDALRSVVSRALRHAAERGLSGDHHFYITFLTGHPGVNMPDHLRSHYPKEMTIVLQHQFWGLEVGKENFSVTLSFANEPERLTVPYAAITAFADPSVRFGLQFDVDTGEPKPGADDQVVRADLPAPNVEAANIKHITRESGAEAEAESGESPPPDRDSTPGSDSDSDSDSGRNSDKVVTLDAFRKTDGRHKT
jgi:hypothetical protein